jgi:hypothetical protein
MAKPMQRFHNLLFDETNWFRLGLDLISSAEALESRVTDFFRASHKTMETAKKSHGKNLRPIPSGGVVGVYFMLVAYGIENLLKGAAIANRKDEFLDVVKRKQKIPKEIDTHELRDLAEQARIETSRDEEEILLRLSANATWRGRYPVPVHMNGLKGKYLKDGTFASQAWYSKEDLRAVKALVVRIRGHCVIQRVP